jgi:hypothetical protein
MEATVVLSGLMEPTPERYALQWDKSLSESSRTNKETTALYSEEEQPNGQDASDKDLSPKSSEDSPERDNNALTTKKARESSLDVSPREFSTSEEQRSLLDGDLTTRIAPNSKRELRSSPDAFQLRSLEEEPSESG